MGGGGRVRLSDIDTRRLLELKYKSICSFKLELDMVGGVITIFTTFLFHMVSLEKRKHESEVSSQLTDSWHMPRWGD
jgi:hypothetical protein